MRFARPFDRVLGTKSRVSVLRYLSLNDLELSGRQIARAVGLSPKPLNRVLAELVTEGVLTQRNIGNTYLFRLNRENPLVSELLIPLFRGERALLGAALSDVFDDLDGAVLSAVIYGSVSRGQEEPDSDVDVLVVASNVEEVNEALSEAAVAFTRRYGNVLSCLVMTPDELRQRYSEEDGVVREALAEGRVVAGGSPWELLHNDH